MSEREEIIRLLVSHMQDPWTLAASAVFWRRLAILAILTGMCELAAFFLFLVVK